MTAFYKFPDDAVYQANKQELIPFVELGRVPDGGEETVEVNGEEVTQPTYFEGYHINTLSPVPGWEAYLVDPLPNSPWMIFG